MSEDKVRVDLDDRIWGITGTIDPDDYKEAATGISSDQELVYIKYRPARKTRNAIQKFVQRILKPVPGIGGDEIRRTPEPVPEKQANLVYTPSAAGRDSDQDLAGQPDRKLVLLQDRDGNAPYEENVRDREKNQLNQLEKEKSRAEGDSLTSKAESIDMNSEDEEKNQDHRGRFDDFRPDDRIRG